MKNKKEAQLKETMDLTDDDHKTLDAILTLVRDRKVGIDISGKPTEQGSITMTSEEFIRELGLDPESKSTKEVYCTKLKRLRTAGIVMTAYDGLENCYDLTIVLNLECFDFTLNLIRCKGE